MAQLSRPYQIALGALVLLAAVWFIALRGHSSSSGNSSSPANTTPSSPSAQASASTRNAGGSGSIYHGSAPGVEGLSRAVAKAHGAVATSQQNAKQVEGESAEASSAASSTTASATSTTSAPTATGLAASRTTHAAAPAKPGTAHGKTTVHTAGQSKAAGAHISAQSTPSQQTPVEHALHEGKVALVLFWNPKGTDDAITHQQLRHLAGAHHSAVGAIAVYESPASAVASYGTITRGVQVYTTPTLLIINPKGVVKTITGSTDAYSIEQTIEEVRKP